MPAYAWKAADARRVLAEQLGVASLEGFGIGADDDHLAAAAAAALRYAQSRALQDLRHVRRLIRLQGDEILLLDGNCRRNLELLRNNRDGGRSGSLLAAIDRSRTAPGSRLLAEAIRERHAAVACLVEDDALRDDLREHLQGVYDLERLLTRVATGRCHARDLVQLASTLRAAETIAGRLEQQDLPPALAELPLLLVPEAELTGRIETTLVEDPPLAITEGGMIRDGIDAELDELRRIKAGAGEWLARYQASEATRTGIPKIKVGYNKVFGYFLEVSKVHSDKAPADYVRKQTLVNAERYITPELKDYEDKALGAEERIRQIESRLFGELREAAGAALTAIQACAEALATADVFAGLAGQLVPANGRR